MYIHEYISNILIQHTVLAEPEDDVPFIVSRERHDFSVMWIRVLMLVKLFVIKYVIVSARVVLSDQVREITTGSPITLSCRSVRSYGAIAWKIAFATRDDTVVRCGASGAGSLECASARGRYPNCTCSTSSDRIVMQLVLSSPQPSVHTCLTGSGNETFNRTVLIPSIYARGSYLDQHVKRIACGLEDARVRSWRANVTLDGRELHRYTKCAKDRTGYHEFEDATQVLGHRSITYECVVAFTIADGMDYVIKRNIQFGHNNLMVRLETMGDGSIIILCNYYAKCGGR